MSADDTPIDLYQHNAASCSTGVIVSNKNIRRHAGFQFECCTERETRIEPATVCPGSTMIGINRSHCLGIESYPDDSSWRTAKPGVEIKLHPLRSGLYLAVRHYQCDVFLIL